ncbi:LANO_0E04698g1_1 [Lachancea nothofagi CBS 11611]|uniref:Probable endonuclease LCL3 n=1 Tax=Lachancea nothofagi CBS 11611 TaxID=1266666 RepID=A0A1G4JSD2_9SACH|nr:LANO_0E04698g1_1 [Lachancea nothofagi CBS 11611]
MSESRSVSLNSQQAILSRALLLSVLLTGSILTGYALFNKHLKQYTRATQIPLSAFRKKWLYGKVTAVGDGDNFHLFHTPGGIWGGWGWLRKVPKLDKVDEDRKDSINWLLSAFSKNRIKEKDKFLALSVPYKGKRSLPTISIRLCGVDAPERAHFGNAAQPFSEEALIWLRHTILGRTVSVKPLAIDQYNRCVAKVEFWTWTGWKNLSLEMVKNGLAVVYEGKTGAEFDSEEDIYVFHQALAKQQRKGLWSLKKMETPGAYKKRTS